MAHPTYIPGYKFKLSSYSATDSPGLKTFVCGLTAQSINFSASAIEATSRDCSDPTAKVLMQRAPGVESVELSGSGLYVVTHYATLLALFRARTLSNWVLERMETVAGVETAQESWAGSFAMTALNLNAPADGQNFADISLTLLSSGEVTWTPDV